MTGQSKVQVGGAGKAGIALGIAGAVALILGSVFDLEGGFVDHPNDPGGATNHGITEDVARQHGFEGDMRTLKRSCPDQLQIVIDCGAAGATGDVCADRILFEDYIAKPRFLDLIPIDLAVAQEVIDTGVNMGPARPSRFFQRAVNSVCGTKLAIDGKIGGTSVKAWADCRANLGPSSCVAMLDSLDQQQAAEYDRLVRNNPRLRVFRRGWQNHRIGNVKRSACFAGPQVKSAARVG